MTTIAPRSRPGVGTRRTGYAIAILINAALLYVVNVRPGWQVLPFLTVDTRQVIGLVNLSLAVGVIANLVYLRHDPPQVRTVGDLVTTGVGLAATVRVWQVFPFDFRDSTFDWALPVRIALVVAIVGATIAMVVNLAVLSRGGWDR